jgi:hypothetical protein
MLVQSLSALCKVPRESGSIWEHLEVLRSTGEGYRSALEVCVWFPDWITLCWLVCFAHMCGCWSGNSSGRIPEQTTSWCSFLGTVRTNTFVYDGCSQLQAKMNLLRSSLWILALWYLPNWLPFSLIWIHSHLSAYCFSFLLLPVLRMIFEFASWVRYLVAAIVMLRWTHWNLGSCCVPIIAVLDVAPTNWLDLDPLPPGCGGCVSMICWCRIKEEADNEKNSEALRTT